MQKYVNSEFYHCHGGSPKYDFRRLGLKSRPVIDFSVNINPLGPPRRIIKEWNRMALEIAHYPSIDGKGIRKFYQKRFGLDPDSILPGNGSIELFYLIPRAIHLQRVAVISPSFHDYVRAVRLAKGEVFSFPLSVETEFAPPSIYELEKLLMKTDALFLGNPNNPTGTVFPAEVLFQLAYRYPNKWLLVDEAFIQFVENSDQITLMTRRKLRPNMLIFHSLTKFYALAGLRIGAVIGHPSTISRLRAFKEPWTINSVAEKVAGILLRCRDYEERTHKLVSLEKQRLYSRLREIHGIKTFVPTANFLLVQWLATDSLDELLRDLLLRGFYVRDCRNFLGLEQNFFRFAIRTPSDNDRLIDAIASITKKKIG